MLPVMFGEDFDHEVRALSLGTKSCQELPNAQNNSHSFTLSDWLFTDSVFDTMYSFFEKKFPTVEPASRKFMFVPN